MKKYNTPSIGFILFETEDVMTMSLQNEGAGQGVSYSDLLDNN